MADRVASELDRLYQESLFQGDDELVFCHPEVGTVALPSIGKVVRWANIRATTRDTELSEPASTGVTCTNRGEPGQLTRGQSHPGGRRFESG
jgi:hypothetical protein